MASPTEYDRQTSFALYSAENPGEAHDGTDFDTEFNAVKVAVDSTQAALADIRRSDGTLAEGIVGLAQFDESVTIGVRSRGLWATATSYTADIETVFQGTKVYRCAVTHVSGVFATDLAAAKWVELANLGVQVLDVNTVDTTHLVNEAVTTAKIQNAAVTTDKLAATSVTLAKLAAEVVNRLVPAGVVVPFCGSTEPAGWLFCYGQVVAQATYPTLFSFIGSGYNTGGEGVGNFRLPDYRGRIPVPKNDMGGVAGSAIDDTAYGAVVTALGAQGGVKNTTLVQANLPNVAFTVSGIALSDPGHASWVPGHVNRSYSIPGFAGDTWGAGGSTTVTTGITVSAQGTAASGGSGTAISRMPPGIIQNFIIKAH